MSYSQWCTLALLPARWRPKLLVTVSMHAPKVALADEGGSTTLVADLGHFTLTTDSQQADSLTEDERAVYDCFQLRWALQAGQQAQQVQQRLVHAG